MIVYKSTDEVAFTFEDGREAHQMSLFSVVKETNFYPDRETKAVKFYDDDLNLTEVVHFPV